MSKPMESQEKYQEILNKIDGNFKIMKNMRPIPESALRQYREESDILLSYTSNAIEGNTFTYDETRLLIKEGITSAERSMREHNDIVGHSRAYWNLYDSLKKGKAVDENFIKELHSKVLQGDDYAGIYRDANVYVGDLISVSYTAPEFKKVPELMRAYTEKLQSEISANVKAARGGAPEWLSLFFNLAEHHVDFERIHPFFDGNGRTGRLLLNYEVMSIGLLPITITPANRKRYSASFSRFDDKEYWSTRPESKYERMAKLLAENELEGMEHWNKMFANYRQDVKSVYDVYTTINGIIHGKYPESAANGLTLERDGMQHKILAYDKKGKNCLFEREDGEYLIALGVPSITGELEWKKEIAFGKGKESLLKAISSVEGFKSKQKLIME